MCVGSGCMLSQAFSWLLLLVSSSNEVTSPMLVGLENLENKFLCLVLGNEKGSF